MADTPDKLEFIFTREDDYRIVPCNGAWAGVTAQGEVKIDFFVECPIVPASVVFGVTPSGGLEELERKEVTPQHEAG